MKHSVKEPTFEAGLNCPFGQGKLLPVGASFILGFTLDFTAVLRVSRVEILLKYLKGLAQVFFFKSSCIASNILNY